MCTLSVHACIIVYTPLPLCSAYQNTCTLNAKNVRENPTNLILNFLDPSTERIHHI